MDRTFTPNACSPSCRPWFTRSTTSSGVRSPLCGERRREGLQAMVAMAAMELEQRGAALPRPMSFKETRGYDFKPLCSNLLPQSCLCTAGFQCGGVRQPSLFLDGEGTKSEPVGLPLSTGIRIMVQREGARRVQDTPRCKRSRPEGMNGPGSFIEQNL